MSREWMDVVPRLWMWALASAALLGAAGCVTGVVDVTRREGRVRQRAWSACGHETEGQTGGRLKGGPDQRGSALLPSIRRAGHQALLSRRVRERVGMTGAGVVALLLIGGQVGWLAGGAAAWGMRWWLRRGAGEDASRSAEDRAAEEQLPLAADLMAACLAAGAGPERAAEAVGGSVGGPLGERLVKASTELRLGAEPALVWGRFAERPWGVEFARCMERAADAGVPAVESVARLAAELRARWTRAANGRARRAAVLVTGPLGLCFLPAFLAIGVAPVLLGLARTLW